MHAVLTSTRHFLHTADWQIGRQYGQFDPQDAAILEEARLEVIAKIPDEEREMATEASKLLGLFGG